MQALKKEKNNPAGFGLLAALVIVIIIAIIYNVSQKSAAKDPTLTAAAPIVATPGHAIHPITASPAVMAIKEKEAEGQEAGEEARKRSNQ